MLTSLIVFAIIAFLVFWVFNQVPLAEPIRSVAMVIVALILILAALRMLPGGSPL